MKRQYLGDSKDSFKWDYHHFLVDHLGYSQLKIVWMMTPDDQGSDGKTSPELFPARHEVLTFCNQLRSCREPAMLSELPSVTDARYSVSFHMPDEYFGQNNRDTYLSSIELKNGQVLFFDPDNGFEPERNFSEKHLRYMELEKIVSGAPARSVITVFQHHRRRKFPDDFSRISERLLVGHSTAIYWHSLMFVCVSSSPETISQVREINRDYAKNRPVKILA